jgi:Na+/proline symporter
MHDLPVAFGKRLDNELRWGRAVTVLMAIAAAVIAQNSGTMVAFLGIFGWGLFASTLVPALAVGLNWDGATREGAIASIATGLLVTLSLETAAYFKAEFCVYEFCAIVRHKVGGRRDGDPFG